MEGSERRDDEGFDVVGSAESAVAEPQFEGTNVCRAAALSTLLAGDERLVRAVGEPLAELGIPDSLSSGERIWSDIDPLGALEDLQERRFQTDRPGGDRVALWRLFQETLAPADGIAFLVAVLGSPLERESAAAAAALSRHIGQIEPRRLRRAVWWRRYERLWYMLDLEDEWWGFPWLQPGYPDLDRELDEPLELAWEPAQWLEIYGRTTGLLGDRYDNLAVISLLVRWRLGRALRSPDPITRSLAQAAFWPSGEPQAAEPIPPPSSTPSSSQATLVSTIIHGTKAWAGDWWEPGGDFHEYIHDGYRSNLYARGAIFSWSGAYRSRDRKLAGARFARWASDVAAGGLETVFGHSYGGEVAARAVASHQTQVDELVFLSTPVTSYINAAAATGIRIVDIRLRFDPILALARTRQRIDSQPNVSQVLLKRWRLDHSASHQGHVWNAEAVAKRGKITPR